MSTLENNCSKQNHKIAALSNFIFYSKPNVIYADNFETEVLKGGL